MRFFVTIVLISFSLCMSLYSKVTEEIDNTLPAVELIKDGVFVGNVYVSLNVDEHEIAAAFDFCKWTGILLSKEAPSVFIETEKKINAINIFIGNTEEAKKMGVVPPTGQGDTYIIEARKNALFILGNSSIATRLAVGEFLERYYQIDFIFPGDDGAEWAFKTNVFISAGKVSVVPDFKWRLMSYLDEEWRYHLGFGNLFLFSHNLGRVFTKEVFEKFPELRPEINGKLINREGGYAPQPNLSSEIAVSIAVDAAKKYFEENPNAISFPLGINDSYLWDESESSLRIYGEMGFYRNFPNFSEYYYSFINKVAKAFQQEESLSNKKLGVIAYLHTQQSPSFKLEPNVFPVLCADRSMWVFDSFKIDDKNLMERWSKTGVSGWGVYDYYYGSPYLFPRQFFEEQVESICFAKKQGADLFYAECGPVVPFDALKVWLTAKLTKNISLSSESLLKEFYLKAYGDASDKMEIFFKECSQIYKSQSGDPIWIKAWNNENHIEFFSEENIARLGKILKEAADIYLNKPQDMLTTRDMRIKKRFIDLCEHWNRAEKFAMRYYANKRLAKNKCDTIEEVFELLKNPVWGAEEIYNDNDYKDLPYRSNIQRIVVSDARASALRRLIDFFDSETFKESSNRKHLELKMRERFQNLYKASQNQKNDTLQPSQKKLIKYIEALPYFSAKPLFFEGFEGEMMRSDSNGDYKRVSPFFSKKKFNWDKNNTINNIYGWKSSVVPVEKVSVNESEDGYNGGYSLSISGKSEMSNFYKTFSLNRNKNVLMQAFVKGKVSIGGVCGIAISWFDKENKQIGNMESDVLPVGKTINWQRLAIVGEAPENATSVTIAIWISFQNEGDSALFDDISLTAWE